METGLANLLVSSSAEIAIGIAGIKNAMRDKLRKSLRRDSNRTAAVMKFVADNIIGKDLIYQGPFGARKGTSYDT